MRIQISGEIKESLIDTVLKQITETKHNNVYIYINSGGGDYEVAKQIYSLLKSCPKKIHTCVYGQCSSSAIMILLAGSSRYATRHSTFMIHPVRMDIKEEHVLTEKFSKYAKEIESDTQDYFEIISKGCTNLGIRKIKNNVDKAFEKDWTFSGADALKYGLVEKLGIPREIIEPDEKKDDEDDSIESDEDEDQSESED